MYTKELIRGNKETDKDKAVGLFVLNGDRKMSYLSLNIYPVLKKILEVQPLQWIPGLRTTV